MKQGPFFSLLYSMSCCWFMLSLRENYLGCLGICSLYSTVARTHSDFLSSRTPKQMLMQWKQMRNQLFILFLLTQTFHFYRKTNLIVLTYLISFIVYLQDTFITIAILKYRAKFWNHSVQHVASEHSSFLPPKCSHSFQIFPLFPTVSQPIMSNLERLLYYIKNEKYSIKPVVKIVNLLTFYKIVIDYKNTRAESQGFQVKKNPFGVFLKMKSVNWGSMQFSLLFSNSKF